MRHVMVASLALAMSAVIHADEVYLVDGRVLEGEVISAPDAAVIDLKAGSGSMVAVQHFERAKVSRIVFGISVRQQAIADLRSRGAALGESGSAEDWWRLSQRAKELGDQVLAKEFAVETIARDRQHVDAHRVMGMVLYNGVWMRPAEVAAARGEILFRGEWMGWAQREAVLADEAKRHDELVAARKVREEQRRVAALQAAAEAEASVPYPETRLGDQGYRLPNTLYYRSVYWPTLTYPQYCPPVGIYNRPLVSIHASGGGSNHAWSFGWNY